MVDNRSVLSWVDQSVILVTFLILLPFQVQKSIGRVLGLCPVGPTGHDLAYNAIIIAFANKILQNNKIIYCQSFNTGFLSIMQVNINTVVIIGVICRVLRILMDHPTMVQGSPTDGVIAKGEQITTDTSATGSCLRVCMGCLGVHFGRVRFIFLFIFVIYNVYVCMSGYIVLYLLFYISICVCNKNIYGYTFYYTPYLKHIDTDIP